MYVWGQKTAVYVRKSGSNDHPVSSQFRIAGGLVFLPFSTQKISQFMNDSFQSCCQNSTFVGSLLWKDVLFFPYASFTTKTVQSIYVSTKIQIWNLVRQVLKFSNLPHARHYNPRFVHLLPNFWSPFLVFKAFFLKFCPNLLLVFNSGF